MASRIQTKTFQQVMHILLVNDDKDKCMLLKQYLTEEGYMVSMAHTGATMRQVIDSSRVDIVLLDLSPRQEDGLVLAHSLRKQNPDIGIIILTERGDTIDRIVGLEMGADDCVVTPIHPSELPARIESVGRRSKSLNSPAAGRSRLRFSGWLFDSSARELFSPEGERLPLTGGEFDLLTAFLSHPNQLLSRDQLLDQTRGRNLDPFDRTIDVHICRLRRKLKDDPRKPRLIKTVRGAGYTLTVPVEVVMRALRRVSETCSQIAVVFA